MSNYVYVGFLGDVYKMHRRDAEDMLHDYLEEKNAFVMPGGNTQYADLPIEDYGVKRLSDKVARNKRNNLEVLCEVENLYDMYEGADDYYIKELLKEL